MEKVLGIDLGTSNSCVAVMMDGVVKVIPDKNGHRIQPSVVHFAEDGSVKIGREAKRMVVLDPENTVYSAKRLIGRKYFSAEVKKAKAICPYEIVEGPDNSVMISIRGKQYTLQEISALIIKKMKQIAEEFLGEEVGKAVITVPAYFNDNQRSATRDAGRIAGLDVIRVINEPTAAALAYGYGKHLSQKVAIYDLGGGTFDISLLELGEDVYEVIATSGDTYLGGDDFDDRIIDYCAERFLEQYKIDLRRNKITLQQLKEAAETAKIKLTSEEQVEINIPAIAEIDGKPVDLKIPLDRKTFSAMVMDLIQRTFKVTDEAMQMARLNTRNLDGVILVGGPTRIPIVRDSIKHYFQKEPQVGIDPDEVVAVGAAIQGDALINMQGEEEMVLLDLTPLSLGIEIATGRFERIIEINTPVPTENTRIFTTYKDNQDTVRIKVYQGESMIAQENELLGEFTLSGFRVAPRGEVKIAVTFEIDTNGILNVHARDVETNAEQSIRVAASGRLSEEKIDELREASPKQVG